MFKPVNPNINFPELEKEILEFWKKNRIFEKSVAKDAPKGKWTFLDGPPFITGLPHYGNILSSLPKDLFPRYKTMQGHSVRRVWGWDCHGLPAENKVEEKLGIKRKKDIEEKIGVKKFIDECKLYVKNVSKDWEWYIDHVGRWIDFKNSYKTMDIPYMESTMWVFKQMYDKGFIYKGLRVSLFCPHCSTPISNFEVAMDANNYKRITESANTYKYKLKGEDRTYLLAWSTTPWNKIATPALAVNPDLIYVKVAQGNEEYILAKTTLKILKNNIPYKILEEFKGKKLLNKGFEPHYNFYPIDPGKRAFVVIGGDFVTADEGTGIVTIAAYGEEDLSIMQKEKIQIVLHVDEEGNLKENVPNWGGMHYLKVNKLVNEDLEKRGLIYQESQYAHAVPHCWRCETRLYYSPQNAWYVNIQTLKPQLKKTNESINWFPKHFKYGRFLKSMEAAPDWCISRSRFWGSPVPVWECECGERFVPGSLKELEEASGKKIPDLHKPEVDELTIPCGKCKKPAKRVTEVLDSWIEAGSAPLAERHFPFEKKLKLEDFFPPDFIVEYTGQIRAWFYVLHVIGTAIFNSNAFKNVLVTGVILGTDGRKMSKNYGNYPDPKELIEKYGGDALRLYLLGSPVMNGEDILISEESYRNQVRSTLLILWNVYNFFVSNSLVDNWKQTAKAIKSSNVLDRWIMSKLNKLIKAVTASLEKYNTFSACDLIENFINDLSVWYVRRSRNRIGLYSKDAKDKNDCYETLWEVLASLCQIMAPFTPFIAEKMYRNLTNEESVHLAQWPNAGNTDEKLEQEMELVRSFCELGHAKRKELGIKVRQPLRQFTIYNLQFTINKELAELIKDELNVKKVTFEKGRPAGLGLAVAWRSGPLAGKRELKVEFDTKLTQELKEEGEAREIIRQIQAERKKLGASLNESVNVVLPTWPKTLEEYIKKKAMVAFLKKGPKFEVKRS